MKSKNSAGNKKPNVTLKDLKTKKNPKGGGFGGGDANVTVSAGSARIGATISGSAGSVGRR